MTFVAGHFGEWLQGLVGNDRTLALITLPCTSLGVRARVTAAQGFELSQNQTVLEPDRCRNFLLTLDCSTDVLVELDIDFPPGGGAGMSTAALVALARASGAQEVDIARACLGSEGASDPLMLDQSDGVLWAPREARVLAEVPLPPAAEIVGGFWGPPSPTDPRDVDFPPVDDLVEAWEQAPSLAEAARIATVSFARTTVLRGPADDPTQALARSLGALGVARAHTGSARSLIFAPGTAPPDAEDTLARAGYANVLRFQTGSRR